MIQTALVYFSLFITAVGTIPYILDVLKKKTKPRIVSWGIWTVLTAVAGLASYSDHQYPAALLMLVAMLEALSIVILGYTHGDKSLERIDIVCLIGAGVGLILWWLSGSAALAVVMTVVVDFIGAIPSIAHSWRKPGEETWLAYFCGGLGGLATVLAVNQLTITSALYPAYIVVMNAIFVAVIIGRRVTLNGRASEVVANE